VLKSIEHPGGRVSLHLRTGDLEVMVVEVEGGRSLVDPTLWGAEVFHLVLDGQAAFHLGDRHWELLPDESLRVDGPTSYTIVNPSPERVRILSIVSGGSAADSAGNEPW
jgi:mannose-6-phosphate isomerase-like protein (cupin superfamily)